MSDTHPQPTAVATSSDLLVCVKRAAKERPGFRRNTPEAVAPFNRAGEFVRRLAAIEQDEDIGGAWRYLDSWYQGSKSPEAFSPEALRTVLDALATLIPTLSQRPEIPT